MRVAIVCGARSAQPMGLAIAERHLLAALRRTPDRPSLELRVVGGRAAMRYAKAVGARWYPAAPGRMPRRAGRSSDLVHLLDLPPPRGRFVATVHDLAPMRFRDEGDLPPWVGDVAARATLLITPSHFTASELGDLLDVPPERIRVVPNGPGHAVSSLTPPLGGSELAELGIRAPFVLRMGGYTERKNVPRLLAAWPEIRRRTGATLALVGPPHDVRAGQLNVAPSLDGVVVLDYVPASLVPGLIRAARVVVSPSIYEGFGLPLLEAMCGGVPVVAVRTPSSEEVCGAAAILVADDTSSLAEGIVASLHDEPLRARLITAGMQRAQQFTWAQAAEQLVKVYRGVDELAA